MLITSSEANKILKTYQEQIDALIKLENQSATFIAATTENVEEVRPEFDLSKTETEISTLQEKVRALKHAINEFNVTTKVPGFDMTVDELLVALPQWTQTLGRYALMKDRLPKTRKQNGFGQTSSIIEYVYTNYDIPEVIKDYATLSAMIDKAHLALDNLNATIAIQID